MLTPLRRNLTLKIWIVLQERAKKLSCEFLRRFVFAFAVGSFKPDLSVYFIGFLVGVIILVAEKPGPQSKRIGFEITESPPRDNP